MSGNWLDLSSTSNRFVQTYVKGFVDISGGNLLLRNNNLILNAGDISLNGRLYIGGDTTLAGNIYVGGVFGANTLAIGKTTVTPGYNLDVNGTVLFEGDVSFGGNVSVNNLSVGGVIQQNSSGSINSSLVSFTYSSISTFAQTTTVNTYTNTNTFLANTYFMSDVSLVGRLYVSNDVSLSGNLTINKAAYIAGDVSMGGRLYVTNDASLGGRLYVAGDASLNGRLNVAGDASLNGRLYVANTASLGGRLYVANDVSLGGRLFVKADVSSNGNTAVGGNLTVNGNIYGNFAASTIPISAIIGGDTSIVDLSYNQTINGNKTFTGLITMTYDMSINGGNLYVSNNTVLGGDVSMNGRLYVEGDVSFNGNVFVNTGLFLGQGQGQSQGYILDISSSNTNGYGAVRIYESVKGTVPTASGGSLIIQHADVSGVSSIVFPSTTNYGKDYGSIAYYETVYGTKYNYYNTAQSTASSALVVNVQKDGFADANTMDSIVLEAAGSVIIDACGQTIIQPKGGPVGIGKTNPNADYALDVSGVVICTYSTTTSDYRIKENVREIPDEYSIDDLNPCSYFNTLSQKEEVGFLAHEVQEKFPFLVLGEKDGEQHQALNYIGIIGLLVKEIKALKRAAQTPL